MAIKVLVVDDSALMRQMLSEMLGAYPDIQVVGAARDPLVAREMIKELNPDVLTLDVEMPRMDGLAFLERLMRLRPMPVVMVSSRTEANAGVTLRALELGAVDFVAKPKTGLQEALPQYAELIAEKIRAAAHANLRPFTQSPPAPKISAGRTLAAISGSNAESGCVVVLGASTGGTEAIREVLSRMPKESPAILIVQHMPEMFTRTFAKRMDDVCEIAVREAEHGDQVLPGHAYIAPGHSHLMLTRRGSGYACGLNQEPPVNRHRPSVDVLFRSAAACAGPVAIGVILTGMGADGAAGMKDLKHAGAYNIAQDESSSVVFGMPKAAIETGSVDKIAVLEEIAAEIINSANVRPAAN